MQAIKLIKDAIRDLLIQKGLLRIKSASNGFAFLIHPRDTTDAVRKYPFAKYLPKKVIEFWAAHFWPVVASRVTGLRSIESGEEIVGWIIVCPLLPRQMLQDRAKAKKRIIQCIKLAEKLGARIIGLGALTASVTRGGLDIQDLVDIKLTSGYAYTSLLITQNVLRLLEKLNLSVEATCVAVVGAAGFIGYITTKLLVEKSIQNLILIDLEKKLERLQHLSAHLQAKHPYISIKISHDISDVDEAHIIIAATNAPDALIKSEHLKPGSIVIDDAQPSDVDPEVIRTRDDVLVVEAAVAEAPGIDCHFNFGLASRHDIFGCLGEVLLLSAAHKIDMAKVGEPDAQIFTLLQSLVQPLNFRLGALQNFTTKYQEEDLMRIKQIIETKHGS